MAYDEEGEGRTTYGDSTTSREGHIPPTTTGDNTRPLDQSGPDPCLVETKRTAARGPDSQTGIPRSCTHKNEARIVVSAVSSDDGLTCLKQASSRSAARVCFCYFYHYFFDSVLANFLPCPRQTERHAPCTRRPVIQVRTIRDHQRKKDTGEGGKPYLRPQVTNSRREVPEICSGDTHTKGHIDMRELPHP